MSENCVSIIDDKNRIYGIIHQPDKRILNHRVFIVFLPAYTDDRCGPQNMYVNLSRRLMRQGFFCFRFDFRGRGYSNGEVIDSNFNSKYQDTLHVINYLQKNFNPDQIILAGLCAGANLAFTVAAGSLKIHHIINMASVELWYTGKHKNEITQTKNIYSVYLNKLFNFSTYKKLSQKDINFSVIFAILKKHTVRFIKYIKYKLFVKEDFGYLTNDNTQDMKQSVLPFQNFKGEILSIYGSISSVTTIAINQIDKLGETYHFNHSWKIVQGSDHYFTAFKHKEELFLIIENWLNGKYEKDKNNYAS